MTNSFFSSLSFTRTIQKSRLSSFVLVNFINANSVCAHAMPTTTKNNNSHSSYSSYSNRVRLPTPQNIQNALIHTYIRSEHSQRPLHTHIRLTHKIVLYRIQAGSYVECLIHIRFFRFGINSSRFDIFYALLK